VVTPVPVVPATATTVTGGHATGTGVWTSPAQPTSSTGIVIVSGADRADVARGVLGLGAAAAIAGYLW